jgi:hypothetical protein
MIPVQITDWHLYLRDGEQFLKTARAAYLTKKKAFSPDAIYNITCMGIEKLIMAFLMQRGDLAENHTMVDLLDALQRHTGFNSDIDAKLRFLGAFQEICDLEMSIIRHPSDTDLQEIVRAGDEIHHYLTPYLRNTFSIPSC